MDRPRKSCFIQALEARRLFSVAYKLTELPTFGGDTQAESMNASAHVVGYSANSVGVDQAFIWHAGKMIDIGALLGAGASVADVISDRGVVAGYYQDSQGHTLLFRYEHGAATILGTPAGFTDFFVGGINNSGEIVGNATAQSNTNSTAYVFAKGKFVPIEIPDGSESVATAINNAGVIVGNVKMPVASAQVTQQVGFVDRKGVVTLLTPGANTNRYLTSINSRGDIIGMDEDTFATGDPPLVNSTPFIDIKGTFSPLYGSMQVASPHSENRARIVVGQIVYYPAFSRDTTSRAWIFTGHTGDVDLNTLISAPQDVLLTNACAINAAGKIAGTETVDGANFAFLLTPKRH